MELHVRMREGGREGGIPNDKCVDKMKGLLVFSLH